MKIVSVLHSHILPHIFCENIYNIILFVLILGFISSTLIYERFGIMIIGFNRVLDREVIYSIKNYQELNMFVNRKMCVYTKD